MGIWLKQRIMSSAAYFCCAVLFGQMLGHGVYAGENSPNTSGQITAKSESGANNLDEQDWSKWDAVVKDPTDANELLDAKWNAVVRVIQSTELNEQTKKEVIDKIISPIFDFDLMAKLVLGRTHWPKLTDAQRERFTDLFAERLKNFYLDKINRYENEKIIFKSPEQKKNTLSIPTVLISDDKEVAIIYKLRKNDEQDDNKKGLWRIYDVEVQGVSILLTYRSQFDDILRRGSVNDLFSQLEKPTTN